MFANNQALVRTAMICHTLGTEGIAQRGCKDELLLWLCKKMLKDKEWVLVEDEPPTKI